HSNDTTRPATESCQTLTVTAFTQARHFTLTITRPRLTSTPFPYTTLFRSFSYTITDNGTTNGSPDPKSATATVSITVTEVNDTRSEEHTSELQSRSDFVCFHLRGNDSTGPANESGQTLTVTAVSQATHGTV